MDQNYDQHWHFSSAEQKKPVSENICQCSYSRNDRKHAHWKLFLKMAVWDKEDGDSTLNHLV